MNNFEIENKTTVYFTNTDKLVDLIEKRNKTVIFACNKNEQYANKLAEKLSIAGHDVYTYITTDGDENKTLDKALIFTQFLEYNSVARGDLIINIGGGTVCDLGAFVASLYMRGITYYNIPTTLLCAVDACIGGKTAVNLSGLKNLWGTFYHPKKAIIDCELLGSLPDNILQEGMSEIVKYAVLSAGFESYLMTLNNLSEVRENLETVIYKCLKIKGAFVEEDERDLSARHALNLGHTVAHAIESQSEYKTSHSVAVALGIVIEAKIAFEEGLISKKRYKKIIETCEKYFALPKIPRLCDLLPFMKKDKKNQDGKIVFALPNEKSAQTVAFSKEKLENILSKIDY